MSTDANLHQQLDPGEVVIDGEPDSWRTVASLDGAGMLWIEEQDWHHATTTYPDGVWESGKRIGLRREVLPRLVAMLTADAERAGTEQESDAERLARTIAETEALEQRDVYRDRCQQLTDVLGLREAEIARLNARRDRLAQSLTALIARIRRVGGYATPEEQDALREAERVAKV